MSTRASEPVGSRRRLAARGTVINSAFQIGLGSLNLLKTVVAAGLLTAADYGVWGALFLTLGLVVAIKTTGVSDKFIQQDEADQEIAFQKAFTLEVLSSLILVVLLAALAPLLALAYGQEELLVPGLVIALVIPGIALQAPIWIFYRRMDFLRQRLLSAVDPVTSFVVTIALAIAGLGYWSLVIGFMAGSWAAALGAIAACPYPLRFRYEHGTMREYFSFSWPLVIAGASGMLIGFLSVFFGNVAAGLAGAGAIALAGNFAAYTDRIDTVITQTIYPAVCRVRDNRELLKEAFTKSNRLTLMWGMPFGIGLSLFAADLIEFGIGDEWSEALVLFQVFGITAALNHIGFNWSAFYRVVGETKPIAKVVFVTTVVFCVTAIPLLLVFGLPGFAAGMAVMTAATLAMRAYFVGQVVSRVRGVRVRPAGDRADDPGGARGPRGPGGDTGQRTLDLALAELALYCVVTIAIDSRARAGTDPRGARLSARRPLSPGRSGLKMQPSPQVAVVVATRDREWRLGALLEALARQSVDPERFEVIVSDDGSRDRIQTLLSAVARRVPFRFRFVTARSAGGPRGGPQRRLAALDGSADRLHRRRHRARAGLACGDPRRQ